jgi:beta-phosphoglucomutase
MIKCVLFDLDGVLVDACEWHYESFNRALEHVSKVRISRKDHETTYNGLPTKTKLNLLVENRIVSKEHVQKIWDLKQEFTLDVISENAKIDQGKIFLHTELKSRNLHVGCVTNSIRKTAELMLGNTGQIDEIDFLLTNEDVKNPKPDPEGYRKAMKFFSVNPEETLIFEDSKKGFMAAMDSGAHVARVSNATEVTYSLVKETIEKLERNQ